MLCTCKRPTLDRASRDAAHVPAGATHFAFGYPGSGGDLQLPRRDFGAMGECFLAAGGFLYFHLAPEGEPPSYQLCGATCFVRSAGQGLTFEGPVQLHSTACRLALAAQGRLVTPTMELFTDCGVKSFSWLAPREPLGPHDGTAWPDGGFAYHWDEADAELDCVFCLDKIREHEPIARLRSKSIGITAPSS